MCRYTAYVNCKDAHFFMSNDKINDFVVAPVILDDEQNPILACQDRFVRVVQGSDLYYEAGGCTAVEYSCLHVGCLHVVYMLVVYTSS